MSFPLPLPRATAMRGVSRPRAWILVLFATCASPHFAGAQCQGAWSNLYDWAAQINPTCGEGELSHAALIPKGLHAGKVLLWRVQLDPACVPHQPSPLDTNETWIFDPAMPTDLIRLVPSTSPFISNIFCAGASWDEKGEALVVGGVNGSPFWPRETYRFRPQNLGTVTTYQGYPAILERPSLPIWVRLTDTAIPYYYPTVLALGKAQLLWGTLGNGSCTGLIPAATNIVLGGPPQWTIEGNEFWSLLPPSPASQWLCPIVDPSVVNLGNHLHNQYLPADRDQYELLPAGNPPEPRLDSYPRAFQVSTGDILVAGDVDTVSPVDPPYFDNPGTCNIVEPVGAWADPGTWWVVRPRRVGAPELQWQMHNPQNSPDQTVDQFYDTAVMLHTIDPQTDERRKDRVIRFGGSSPGGMTHTNPATAWTVNDTVQEFVKAGLGPNSVIDGTWHTKRQDARLKRLFANAVILPTGDIFLEGGTSTDSYSGHNGTNTAYVMPTTPCPPTPPAPDVKPDQLPTPVTAPILYDPGNDAQAQGTITDLCPPPGATPRLYHHLALLLLDGSVWVGGGTKVGMNTLPMFSGEVFRPPYMSLSFQPSISNFPPLIAFDHATTYSVDVLRQPENCLGRPV